MSTPRTVTVTTTDQGPVIVPEPSWCAGHADQPVDALAVTLGPDAVRELAADYETAAAQLRRLADWVHILKAGEVQ
ncbi:hypothetical protein [Streptomyces griseus]|uniref:hypothetical protein n=1 Tax=Streptomyces griseus TaxID=1911 RepID=UPI003807102D